MARDVARHAHVSTLASEDLDRRGERRATTPLANGPRVARIGQRAAIAKVGANEQRVRTLPAHASLRFWHDEAAGLRRDEGLGAQIELAHHRGIGATTGQVHQRACWRAAVRGPVSVVPLVHPALSFLFVEGVDRQHHLPLGFACAIRLERGPTQHAAWVLIVGPEVVVCAADFGQVGDLVLRGEDGVEAVVERGARWVAAEASERLLVARAHPGERSLAEYLL